MDDPRAQRIDLESKISFVERTVDALNEVILDQNRRIDELETKLER